jgi:hypothetical protein
MHTYTRTNAHTHTHTRTIAAGTMHVYTYMKVHAHTQTRAHTQAAWGDAQTHTHKNACTNTYTHNGCRGGARTPPSLTLKVTMWPSHLEAILSPSPADQRCACVVWCVCACVRGVCFCVCVCACVSLCVCVLHVPWMLCLSFPHERQYFDPHSQIKGVCVLVE